MNNPSVLNYSFLSKELNNGIIKPSYFFYGAENYLIEQALHLLKKVALEPGTEDFNWHVFRADANDVNWETFADSLSSLALIPARRLVVLKQLNKALRNKSVKLIIESTLKLSPEDLTLILIEEDPDLKKAFFKNVIQNSTPVFFPSLKPIELQQYLAKYVAGFKKEISDAALEKILTESEPNLRELLHKMEVLVNYSGDKPTISPQDVEKCTAFTREVEVYNLLQALGKKDASSCRQIVGQLLERKVEIGALFSLLYRQIWAMYRMKYLQEQRIPHWKWQEQLKIWPQFLEKRYRQYLPNYTRAELGKSLEILAEADNARKTSAVQDDILLQTLTEKLLKP